MEVDRGVPVPETPLAFWGYLGTSSSSGRLLYLLLCGHHGDCAKGSVLLGRELLKEPTGDKSIAALPFKSALAGAFVPKASPGGGDSRENQTREAKVCK